MVRATTLMKNAKAKAASMNSDKGDAINDCVKEGRMESNAALWYLDLIHDLFITEHEIAAVNVLSCVLHHADSPICSELEGLFRKFVDNEYYLVSFMDDFLGHEEVDDYLLELEMLKMSRKCLQEKFDEEADE